MADLIQSREELIGRIHTYQSEVRINKELAKRMSSAQAWYEHEGEYGPSKFVGYADLPRDKYLALTRRPRSEGGLDGRVTEHHLRKLMPELAVSTDAKYQAGLSVFINEINGTEPNKRARIYSL
jgi:hypothetical protein